jgi:hypothetical protein
MNDNDKVTKVLNVYMGSDEVDFNNPTFMITYRVHIEEKSTVVREDVRVLNANAGTNKRYYGKTPIVFIQSNDMHNADILNMAKTIKEALEDEEKVVHERNIKTAVKTVLKGKTALIKKNVFYGAYGEIVLRRPNTALKTLKTYVAYTNSMLENAKVEVE